MALVENKMDPACPVMTLTLLRMYSPPEQKYVFCAPSNNNQKHDYITKGLQYKSNPNVHIGGHFMAKWCCMLLCHVGCEGWELIKNHCIRGGMATILNIEDVSCFVLLVYLIYCSYNTM